MTTTYERNQQIDKWVRQYEQNGLSAHEVLRTGDGLVVMRMQTQSLLRGGKYQAIYLTTTHRTEVATITHDRNDLPEGEPRSRLCHVSGGLCTDASAVEVARVLAAVFEDAYQVLQQLEERGA